MSTLVVEGKEAVAQAVRVTDDALVVELSDGRIVSVPLAWFPRLQHANRKERARWSLIGRGEGIRWPELDEDIHVDSLVLGHASAESQRSFKKWLDGRSARKK